MSLEAINLEWVREYYWNRGYSPYFGGINETGTTLTGIVNIDNSTSWWAGKLDNNGEEFIWEQSYKNQGYQSEGGYSIFLDDGSIVLAGQMVNEDGPSNHLIVLLKVDENGDSLWFGEYGEPHEDFKYRGFIHTPEGGFILAAYSRGRIVRGCAYTEIYHVNSEGQQDTVHYHGEEEINYSCTGIAPAGDNGFAIGGIGEHWDRDRPYHRGFLSIFDEHGGQIRTIAYTDSIQLNNGVWRKGEAKFIDLEHTSDGGFVLAGNLYLIKQFLWIVKTDEDGDVVWDRKIEVPREGFWEHAIVRHVRETEDGGFLTFSCFYGEDDRGLSYPRIHIDNLDADGEIIEELVIDSLDLERFFSVTRGADDTFYCTRDKRIFKFNLEPNSVSHRPDYYAKSFQLDPAFPNPFNSYTRIKYGLPVNSRVRIQIYDVMGREVITLSDGQLPAGYHTALWKSENNAGNPVASGVYFYRIQAGDFSSVKKMTLVR